MADRAHIRASDAGSRIHQACTRAHVPAACACTAYCTRSDVHRAHTALPAPLEASLGKHFAGPAPYLSTLQAAQRDACGACEHICCSKRLGAHEPGTAAGIGRAVRK